MSSQLNDRYTRVQLIIVENGQYILLKHLDIKADKTFWGIPGGGVEAGESEEEAAIREAEEETGLTVRLLPVKFELELPQKRILYHRIVTYLAYPVAGEAKTGYEPEAEQIEDFNYRLLDLKWQDFYHDEGIDKLVKEAIVPIRKGLKDIRAVQKAGAVIYRRRNGKPEVLLISARRDPSVFVLPQGHIDPGETPMEAAIRETREETGLVIESRSNLGFFLHERENRVYQTYIFAAEQTGETEADERRTLVWMNAAEIERADIPVQSKRLLQRFMEKCSD